MKSKKLIYFTISLIILVTFTHFVIGFNHIPHHFNDLKQLLGISISEPTETNQKATIEGDKKEEINGYNTVLDADKISYKHTNVTYPFDTTMYVLPEIRKEELNVIKDSKFENLVKATNYPTLEEVRVAFINSYPYFTHYWINDNLRFDLGTFYEAKFNKNTNCVSAMIILYDSKTKRESNSRGIEMMETAYDFFQYKNSDGRWYVKHISQNIPYDYSLNKKYREN